MHEIRELKLQPNTDPGLMEFWAPALRSAPSCDTVRPSSAAEAVALLGKAVPIRIEGLVSGDEGNWLPDAALQSDADAMVALSDAPFSSAPVKLPNRTLLRPSERRLPLRLALRELRRANRTGHYAYVRHMPLERLPALHEALAGPIARALHMAGPGLRKVNLWLGNGGLRSAVHYDGEDNLLLQLRGSKHVALFAPSQHAGLGYAAHVERRYVFDAESREFAGSVPGGVAPVENHSPLAVFARDGGVDGDEAPAAEEAAAAAARLGRVKAGAVVCTLQPGQALFLPALWSHAVVSTVDASAKAVAAEAAATAVEAAVATTEAAVEAAAEAPGFAERTHRGTFRAFLAMVSFDHPNSVASIASQRS